MSAPQVIAFTWDSRDLEVWRGTKVDGAVARAMRLAGNQALRSMQGASDGYVRRRKYLRRETVIKGLPLVYPGRKEAIRDLVWRMKVDGEPVPLSRFPFISTKTGVSVRVNVGGGTKRIKSAFVVTFKSGHKAIARRRGKKRLPVDELWTTRLTDTMRDEKAAPEAFAAAEAKMAKAWPRGLDRELKKLVRKGET